MRTTLSHLSSAEICRQQGWQVGTNLVANSPTNFSIQIRITAIGERAVLARLVAVCGVVVEVGTEEAMYDLHCRDWEATG